MPIIPPSPRPLLLWLAASAVCATLLTIEGVTLLTLWRRPSRPWRLGQLTLLASVLGWMLTGHTLGAYHDLAPIGVCYVAGCVDFFPLVTHAVEAALTLGILLACVTAASLVAALTLSATDGVIVGARRMESASARISRLLQVACGAIAFDAGSYVAVEGVRLLYWAISNQWSPADDLGPAMAYGDGVFSVVGGALALGLGALLLWRAAWRREPRPEVAPAGEAEGASGA
ncbi:MAG TPA: hypothetical protein VF812_12340 [Ktedonobacterales bacterium]